MHTTPSLPAKMCIPQPNDYCRCTEQASASFVARLPGTPTHESTDAFQVDCLNTFSQPVEIFDCTKLQILRQKLVSLTYTTESLFSFGFRWNAVRPPNHAVAIRNLFWLPSAAHAVLDPPQTLPLQLETFSETTRKIATCPSHVHLCVSTSQVQYQ